MPQWNSRETGEHILPLFLMVYQLDKRRPSSKKLAGLRYLLFHLLCWGQLAEGRLGWARTCLLGASSTRPSQNAILNSSSKNSFMVILSKDGGGDGHATICSGVSAYPDRRFGRGECVVLGGAGVCGTAHGGHQEICGCRHPYSGRSRPKKT